MSKVSQIELFFYAAIYVSFVIGYQLYCKELEEKPYYGEPSYEVRVILWGFYNPQGTDYSGVVENFKGLPYFVVYCLLCLLINISNMPYKMMVVEFVSIGIMISFYGVTLIGVIVTMMIVMAIIGKYLRGIKVLPQFLGFMLLSFVGDFLSNIKWLNFREHLSTTSMSYPGFYAQVIRAMMICCDYASSPEPVSWKHLFSESIGFSAFTNIFMPGSFILFNDWKQWKYGMHEFVWSGPFKMVPKKTVGKETTVRTLSITNFVLRILRVTFWVYFYKYFMCAVDISKVMLPITDRILRDQGQISDWGVLSYVTLMIIMRFNVFYVIFYNVSRLVGDLQQFFLSPAFSPDSDKLISGDEKAMKVWRKALFVEKLFRVEIETECLMPEGPCCTMCVETSSAIWRKFDTGLYNVLKHYIYIPWMDVVTTIFVEGEAKGKQKLSPLVSNFSAICGAIITFIFVLTFHHWNKGNQIWVVFSFTLWLIERVVIKCNKKYGICNYLERRLSPSWEQRIRCGACTLLQLVNMMSFYCFVTQFETGWFMMKTMVIYPWYFIISVIIEYTAQQIPYMDTTKVVSILSMPLLPLRKYFLPKEDTNCMKQDKAK